MGQCQSKINETNVQDPSIVPIDASNRSGKHEGRIDAINSSNTQQSSQKARINENLEKVSMKKLTISSSNKMSQSSPSRGRSKTGIQKPSHKQKSPSRLSKFKKSNSKKTDRTMTTPSPHRQNHPPIPMEWKNLCEKHLPKLIAPIDVSTAIEERIASITNILEPTQILRIQRRVRKIVRDIKTPNTSSTPEKMDLLSTPISAVSGAAKEKTKLLLSKEKLIDETMLRIIFAGGDCILRRGWEAERPWLRRRAKLDRANSQSKTVEELEEDRVVKFLVRSREGSNSTHERKTSTGWLRASPNEVNMNENWEQADPLGSTFIILMAIAESRWDFAATAAAAELKNGGLEENETGVILDKKIPKIEPPVVEGGGEATSGVTFSSLCLIVAMALYGTRKQKILLLFHILLPPKHLKTLLSKHTFPTWILEESSDILLSLSSIFYHYETCKHVRILNIQACDTLALLICAIGMVREISNESPPSNDQTPISKQTTTPFSTHSQNKSYDFTKKHSIESILASVRDGTFIEPFPYAHHFWKSIPSIFSTTPQFWSFTDFSHWADTALDDFVLDVIFHRLFGSGVLLSPFIEKNLVAERWLHWQRSGKYYWASQGMVSKGINEERASVDIIQNLKGSKKSLFSKLFNGNGSETMNGDLGSAFFKKNSTCVWGGLGGVDGRGGLGHGTMYIVEKRWWDMWKNFVGWEESSQLNLVEANSSPTSLSARPPSISNELLLDQNLNFSPGSLGSFYALHPGLVKDVDYVLVPPSVWDVIYEMYGGGPPLPRIVIPSVTDENVTNDNEEQYYFGSEAEEQSVEIKMDAVGNSNIGYTGDLLVLPIPTQMEVAVYPWVLHCHVCDPYQPYRRGDNGPMSIRVMSLPTQPLWRVFSEILERLPIHQARAIASNGKGIARLWKKVDLNNARTVKVTTSRYGPWTLLCRNRHAPFSMNRQNGSTVYTQYIEEWIEYTDNTTVDSIGLTDSSHLMLEFALVSKGDSFVWPREAAAKAGRQRRLADEDASFRQYLRGLNTDGTLLDPPPPLVGTTVDAMDSTGRWYQAEITKVEIWNPTNTNRNDERDDDTEEEDDDDDDDNTSDTSDNENMVPGEITRVCIDFKFTGGYDEWIYVSSDRLAVKGRCTGTSFRNFEGNRDGAGATSATNSDQKGKSTSSGGNANSSVRKGIVNGASTSSIESSEVNGNSSTSLCPFPGYGVCGLTNLGNTCYANAALQCMGYLPLLRAYLLSNSYKIDSNKDNPLGTGGRVLEEYAELLRVLWSGKHSVKAPSRFKNQLGKANGQFAGNDQQDAQELLLAILDFLHEDSNKVRKKPMVPAMEDAWVDRTPVPRVGREAWWRYLRRNKSVITNTAFGQVMNRVTCPACSHSSLNFDPFGMLSIPFPTVNEVIFRCTLMRRGSTANCPKTLAKRKVQNDGRSETQEKAMSPPSASFIFEQYAVSISRLADIGDLKSRLQNLTGIPNNQLKLYTTNNVNLNKRGSSDIHDKTGSLNTYTHVIPLPDKPGPCFQIATQLKPSASAYDNPTVILAFESTLNPRNLASSNNDLDDVSTTSGEESEDYVKNQSSHSINSNAEKQRQLENQLRMYGDNDECVRYDSDPTILSKAMSRNLWPKNASEFTIGVRVDAIDHRKQWFPGSIVEIIDVESSEQKQAGDLSRPTKVKIHFDNFATKWDEFYTIHHFQRGQICPLYSHAVPKPKPLEFMVYHRRENTIMSIESKETADKTKMNLFGHPFLLECHTEWSTARTGAHILAQASRFLQNKISTDGLSSKKGEETFNGINKSDVFNQLLSESSAVINEIIHVLVENDYRHVMTALSSGRHEKETRGKDGEKRRRRRPGNNPGSSLRKKLTLLLPKLPFEILVRETEGGGKQKNKEITEEIFFPFSLVRTIGNFMTTQSSIILDWKDVSTIYDRIYGTHKSQFGSQGSFTYPDYPLLYTPPKVAIHKQSCAILYENRSRKSLSEKVEQKKRVAALQGGMQLGACLDEFCKELHAEGWTCPKCKKNREGRQRMTIWRLPDLMTFHIKRFNSSARWREKISTKVNFPLTGLNMRKWCDSESPAFKDARESTLYDLIGVINHYGGMTGGHYVAACKATQCSTDGIEEVAHAFTGAGISAYELEGETVQTGWRLGRSKEKDQTAAQSKIATASARRVAESSEPLWLQFDDDLVEPIPPRNVVSETAYVLFYRRRRLTPANIAKYTALD